MCANRKKSPREARRAIMKLLFAVEAMREGGCETLEEFETDHWPEKERRLNEWEEARAGKRRLAEKRQGTLAKYGLQLAA